MGSIQRDCDEWSDNELKDKYIKQVQEIKTRKYEELGTSETKPMPLVENPPMLKLKPLPCHSKYAFLGANDTLPVIISFSLIGDHEQHLLEVLREHKEAIGQMM